MSNILTFFNKNRIKSEKFEKNYVKFATESNIHFGTYTNNWNELVHSLLMLSESLI